jgi:hypothetical protein
VSFQPILGALHHSNFKKFQTRTAVSYAHIGVGRIAITLGIINGGLGFMLAQNTTSGPIAYGIIAGLIWCVYVASIIIGERRRGRNAMPPKYDDINMQSNTSSPLRRSENPIDGEPGAVAGYYARRK